MVPADDVLVAMEKWKVAQAVKRSPNNSPATSPTRGIENGEGGARGDGGARQDGAMVVAGGEGGGGGGGGAEEEVDYDF